MATAAAFCLRKDSFVLRREGKKVGFMHFNNSWESALKIWLVVQGGKINGTDGAISLLQWLN